MKSSYCILPRLISNEKQKNVQNKGMYPLVKDSCFARLTSVLCFSNNPMAKAVSLSRFDQSPLDKTSRITSFRVRQTRPLSNRIIHDRAEPKKTYFSRIVDDECPSDTQRCTDEKIRIQYDERERGRE